MKVKLFQIINANQILGSQAQKKVNGLLAYKLFLNLKEIHRHVEAFEDSRKIIVGNYSVSEEGSSEIKFENEEQEAKANEEFNELMNSDVEIQINKFTLKDLENFSELSTLEISQIDWMIGE